MAIEIQSGKQKKRITHFGESNAVHDKRNILLVGARTDLDGEYFVRFTERNAKNYGQNNDIPEVRLTPENSPITHLYCGVTATAKLTSEPLKRYGGLMH